MTDKLSIVLFTHGLSFSGNTINQHSLGGAETAFTYLAKKLSMLLPSVFAKN